MNPILQTIKTAERILVTAHTDPDGDAVGSLLAMGLALERLGKRTTLYNESPIPAVYQFLPTVGRIDRHLEVAAAFDTAVILDCGDLPRIGGAGCAAISRAASVINIDHHVSTPVSGLTPDRRSRLRHGGDRLPPDPGAGSLADKEIATCIYTGILTDTGSFRFSNTNASAFAISREMVEAGVDPFEVAQHVFGSYSLGRIKLLNLALNSIEISPNGKLSLMTVTRGMLEETRTQQEDVDGLINYARRIEAVRVAALIQEQINGRAAANGRVRLHVSLRSDGSVDVAAIAGTFGGGGHHSAAGFQIESTLADIKSELLAWAEGMG